MSRRAEALGLAGLLVAAGLLFARGLDAGANYDEGVYLASADALDRGEQLGTEVFASQPPGFYVLLRLATALPGGSLEATRALFLVLGLLGVAAAWSLGRTLAGNAAALAAGALLLAAPSFASESARIAADLPAVAFALVSLALLAAALRQRSDLLAAAAGLALAVGVSVKLFAVVAAVPATAMLLSSRTPRRPLAAFAAGLAVVPLAFVAVYAGSLGELYDDAVGFHNSTREGSLNIERVARSFDPRTVWTWLVAAAAVLWAIRGARPRSIVPLWLWAAAATGFLIWHRPLLDHHFALFAAAFSVAAGGVLGPLARNRAAVGALALVVAAGYAQQWRRSDLLAQPEPEIEAAAAAVRAATTPSDPLVTDLPIVAYLADRPLPGELVDTSAVRFESGSLDAACVLSTADASGARIVVVGRIFHTDPVLLAAIRTRFPTRRAVGEITLYERTRAAARAAQAAAPESCSGPTDARSRSRSAIAPPG
jgi:4-amino-4-deoxy-L-arabinose transferase-like glycosyltransferase